MDTAPLAKLLEDEKIVLEKELSALGRKKVGVPHDYEFVAREEEPEADSLDEAQQASTQEEDQSIFTNLEERYDEVLGALARVKEGTYGVCSVCGAQIAAERLQANPAATVCTVHQT